MSQPHRDGGGDHDGRARMARQEPVGITFADFRAARERYLERLRELHELDRLERAFAAPAAGESHDGG